MLAVVLIAVVAVAAVLALWHAGRDERARFATERCRWASERSELLNRIQAPETAVTQALSVAEYGALHVPFAEAEGYPSEDLS